MNQKKTAVFVEGLTEQIFVREMLYAWYGYDTNKLGLKCYSLRADKFFDAPYDLGTLESEHYYQIVNVGNDESVLSKMIREVGMLQNKGYSTIIGLRDMYGDNYKRLSQSSLILPELNEKFINGAQEVINQHNLQQTTHIRFAVMEIESWFLGMETLFSSIDQSLTTEEIKQQTNIDLTQDPETTTFHPYVSLCKILDLKGIKYKKHESDISSLISNLSKVDYELLLDSGKCPSFKSFLTLLIGSDI